MVPKEGIITGNGKTHPNPKDDGMTGNVKATTTADPHHKKEACVKLVKDWQRRGREEKAQWHDFCQQIPAVDRPTHFDPATYNESSLVEFVLSIKQMPEDGLDEHFVASKSLTVQNAEESRGHQLRSQSDGEQTFPTFCF
jgi:hypothetical protein